MVSDHLIKLVTNEAQEIADDVDINTNGNLEKSQPSTSTVIVPISKVSSLPQPTRKKTSCTIKKKSSKSRNIIIKFI